jgi:hypothetical protein
MIQPTTNLEKASPRHPASGRRDAFTGSENALAFEVRAPSSGRIVADSYIGQIRRCGKRYAILPPTGLRGTDLPEHRYGAPWLDAGYHTPAISDRAALYEWPVTRLECTAVSHNPFWPTCAPPRKPISLIRLSGPRGTHQKRRSITVSGPPRTLASHAITGGLERIYAERTRRR